MSEEKTILKDFIPQLQKFVRAETVFGVPYEIGNITVIPVNSVRVGFGFGNHGGIKRDESSAGGGGVVLTPVAFLIIKNDAVSIHNLSGGTLENLMEKVPEFMEKTIHLTQKVFEKKSKSNQTDEPDK